MFGTKWNKGGEGGSEATRKRVFSVLTLIHGLLLCIYDPQPEKVGQHVCLNMVRLTVLFVFVCTNAGCLC